LEELKKDKKDKAKPNQKVHLKDERDVEKMAESMAAGDMEQLEEDVAMLRQILDNLLAFLYLRKTL
jgi:uncharacterized protein YceH (UPF0502 family)